MSIITIAVSFIISIVISNCIGIWAVRKNTVSKKYFESILSEKTTIENKLNDERCNYDRLINEKEIIIDGLRNELHITRDKASVLEHIKNENSELKNKIESVLNSLNVAREKVSALDAERNLLNEQRESYSEQLRVMQENFKLQFENIGNKIFSDHSKTFKQESQSNLTELLSPLKSDIEGFKRKIEESFGAQAREQHSLKSEIDRMLKSTDQMTSQTTNLTKALKGDFRVQGNWGEIILEKILEESGLRAGIDYIVQGSEMGMKHPETGQTLKPDVIVNLPEDKHIIIDSKVSLTDYERYFSEENEQIRLGHLKQFLLSVKKHVNDLEQRRYQDVDQLKTPDFVLMFMPIEGAFSLAVQGDSELHSSAWGKKVVIVSPSTLFATLRTISSIWRLELQNKHAIQIAKEGGRLYDKIVAFVEDMQKLGKQLNLSQTTFSTAMNKLSEGRGAILSKTELLKTLGAKASKNLPKIIPEAFDDQSEQGEDSDSMDEIEGLDTKVFETTE